ncbi:MAG: UDP-3-O-(3-hydroxymyristoyl)glucosamine N-acyltransferase [Planctomycetota bacterium]|jgi:UDP-3-O-[3-hydroxymyristoyl] glucosamine N-acyltransferase
MSDQPSITAEELAERVGGRLEGDGTRVLREVATLEKAGPDTISWVGTVDFLAKIAESRAGVVLVPRDCEVPSVRNIIRVADPDVAMCVALECLAPPTDAIERGVHTTAVVSPDADVEGAAVGANVYVGSGAVVGNGTQLFPGVFVGTGVHIGSDCVLWPNVVIRERVTIGDRVVIHPNATIGADGYGYLQREGKHRKIPQIGTVVIEDDVEIGAGSTIDRARSGVTRIGRGTKIDNLVQIGHNVDIGEDCIIVAMCAVGGSSSLGHHVVMGGQVGVTDHVHIGNGVQIAGKSSIMHDIPDGRTIRGIPGTENHRFLRERASLRKLPEWIKRFRTLARRVEQLEERA